MTWAEQIEELCTASERWRAAQESVARSQLALMATAQELNAAGWSEYALAGTIGVSRATVRAWLGKGKR